MTPPQTPLDRLVGFYREQGTTVPARIQAGLDGRAKTNQFEVVVRLNQAVKIIHFKRKERTRNHIAKEAK